VHERLPLTLVSTYRAGCETDCAILQTFHERIPYEPAQKLREQLTHPEWVAVEEVALELTSVWVVLHVQQQPFASF
jgi:hypothetical protein